MNEFSYLATAALFSAIFLLLAVRWRAELAHGSLMLASFTTAVWAGAISYQTVSGSLNPSVIHLFDFARYLTWLAFLWQALLPLRRNKLSALVARTVLGLSFFSLSLLLITTMIAPQTVGVPLQAALGIKLGLVSYTLLALSALIPLELLLYHSLQNSSARTQSIFYLGISSFFLYDFWMYAHALLKLQINEVTWEMRGIIYAIAALALLVPVLRPIKNTVLVSYGVIRHSVFVLFAALYLFITYLCSEYITSQAPLWVEFSQIALLILGVSLAASWLASEKYRIKIKVFLYKHFFNYKYDYREEWLRFIRALSTGGPGAHLLETVVKAMAQIVSSNAGVLWLRSDAGFYEPVATYQMHFPETGKFQFNDSLVQFLSKWQWVISLAEYQSDPDLYQELQLPQWLKEQKDAWLIIPLMQDIQLLGFVLIAKPTIQRQINWEDHDLLKTAGRQAATHLAQLMAIQALVEAREFQAFSRLSAFVIHDLKNLISQLSLVVTNAARHKHNPQFMEDAINTVSHSVDKMNLLLTQLKKGTVKANATKPVELSSVVKEVIAARSAFEPRPVILRLETGLNVIGERERIASMIQHLTQNAQEATPAQGLVAIRLYAEKGWAILEIEDNGCGMDAQFIRDRLFRPFDTTKGQGGMGIGAYQSREHVREMGGDMEVISEPSKGTLFRTRLPICLSNSDGKPKNSEISATAIA